MSSRIFILTFDFSRAVDAVMLTGNTSKREKDDIKTRLNAMASGNAVREIKLCYVTVRALRFKYRRHDSQQHTQPEMIAKNNAFKSLMERLGRSGKLGK